MLRSIASEPRVAIKNVVLIQIEGLGEALVRHERQGKPVMPYLSGLAQSSIYFANFFQSFNSTDGAVFSAVSGFPETFVERNRKDFLAYDMGGHYPSLSRVLGDDDYDHYFFQGFRHRAADYLSFMKNQGYVTYGIDYFENLDRTKGIDAEAVNALGVYDGVLLQEAARIISRKSSKGFTAHIVTATTHSPWTHPKQFRPVFANNRMNVFHYVDRSLEAFVNKLRDELPDFDRTLFVITGDHTSAAVEDDDAERIRVPLILVNAQLAGLRGQFEKQIKAFGSHMDIVPTILGLLGQPYCYSGMGMDLLSSKSVNKGAITSNRRESYYLQGSFILTYAPNRNTSELRAFDQKRIIHGDISQKYPEVFDRMKLEYLAFYETSKRLTREKATFPRVTPRPPCR